jgi:hypothetical protein
VVRREERFGVGYRQKANPAGCLIGVQVPRGRCSSRREIESDYGRKDCRERKSQCEFKSLVERRNRGRQKRLVCKNRCKLESVGLVERQRVLRTARVPMSGFGLRNRRELQREREFRRPLKCTNPSGCRNLFRYKNRRCDRAHRRMRHEWRLTVSNEHGDQA